jgi:L-histidine Nalpha-methyltransferase / hercynylcysteine S-oxide synthase
VPLSVAKNWPFIGSYDELNAYAASKGGRLPTEGELTLFRDLYGNDVESNLGFRHWHPIPYVIELGLNRDYMLTASLTLRPKAPKNGMQGHNGGVWEWTSTVFDTYDGFVASKLYPG